VTGLAHPEWCRRKPLCSAATGGLHISSPIDFRGTGAVALTPDPYDPAGPWAAERWSVDLRLAQLPGGTVEVRAALEFLPPEDEELDDDAWASRVSDRWMTLPLPLAEELSRALAYLTDRAKQEIPSPPPPADDDRHQPFDPNMPRYQVRFGEHGSER
jgi:hypothetical protein